MAVLRDQRTTYLMESCEWMSVSYWQSVSLQSSGERKVERLRQKYSNLRGDVWLVLGGAVAIAIAAILSSNLSLLLVSSSYWAAQAFLRYKEMKKVEAELVIELLRGHDE